MPTTNLECREQVEKLFAGEFGFLLARFDLHVLEGDAATSTPRAVPPRPGVYVWIAKGRVCKVGKSQSNSLERARPYEGEGRDRAETQEGLRRGCAAHAVLAEYQKR